MNQSFKKPVSGLMLAIVFALTLAACGGGGGGGATPSTPSTNGGGGSGTPASTYSVGGSVAGMTSGISVTLQNNAGDDLTVSAVGTFTFATKLADKAAYAVTVKTQPSNQTCTVTNGAGNVSAANVTNISVSCTSTVVIGDPVTPSTGELGTSSNPVIMPTLADYKVDPAAADGKCYRYLLQQTGSKDQGEYLCIKSTGATSFLGENYPSIFAFFDDKGKVYGNQACSIFPLYVGKTGTCARTYTKSGSVGSDTQEWSVDSLVDVTVLGKPYRALKIVTKQDNTILGKWTFNQYFVPSLYQYVLLDSKKDDGSVSVKLTLTSIQ